MGTDVLQNEAQTRTKAESSAFNGGRKERKHHIVGGSHCKILLQSGAERSRDTPMVLELLECHSVCMWLCVYFSWPSSIIPVGRLVWLVVYCIAKHQKRSNRYAARVCVCVCGSVLGCTTNGG